MFPEPVIDMLRQTTAAISEQGFILPQERGVMALGMVVDDVPVPRGVAAHSIPGDAQNFDCALCQITSRHPATFCKPNGIKPTPPGDAGVELLLVATLSTSIK